MVYIPSLEKPRVKETCTTHQPVVICIDTSGSMNEKAEDGRTKIEIVEQMVNSLSKIDLSESEKGAVDICILAFDDECRVLQDWFPLSDFKGNLKLNAGGCTALGSAIINSIDAIRARRNVYTSSEYGIEARKAQIFLYTDGVSTEDMSKAIEHSQNYLNRDKPSAKLYTILIPPATDPREMKKLGEKVAILRATDCVNGIPSTFKFLKDSILTYGCAQPDVTVRIRITKGVGFIDGQGGAKKDANDGAVVQDTDIWDFGSLCGVKKDANDDAVVQDTDIWDFAES